MRVLLVEDDEAIAVPLQKGLEREGFGVQRVRLGRDALASAGNADVVLLDLGLPDMDGFEVCRRLRQTSEVPVIVVSARGEEVDRVIGLELGADDYLVKPFGIRELVARIRAVSRRAGPDGSSARAAQQAAAISVGGLEIDLRAHRVTVDGVDAPLTPKEFDLLVLLASDPGAVQSRATILREVWSTTWVGPTKTIDMHVASLRRKLGRADWIETVRGVGFRLVPPT